MLVISFTSILHQEVAPKSALKIPNVLNVLDVLDVLKVQYEFD